MLRLLVSVSVSLTNFHITPRHVTSAEGESLGLQEQSVQAGHGRSVNQQHQNNKETRVMNSNNYDNMSTSAITHLSSIYLFTLRIHQDPRVVSGFACRWWRLHHFELIQELFTPPAPSTHHYSTEGRSGPVVARLTAVCVQISPRAVVFVTIATWVQLVHSYCKAEVYSAFYPLWDDKISISIGCNNNKWRRWM